VKSRLPWILLALSLIFNAGFLAGYMRARRRAKMAQTPQGRAALTISYLRLTPEQDARFTELAKAQAAETERLALTARPKLEMFWQEARRENPDSGRVRQLAEEMLPASDELTMLRVEYLLKYLRIMTPEQRGMLIQSLKDKSLPGL